MTTRTIVFGSFGRGFKSEFIAEWADGLGFTEDEMDEQLSLLLNIRLEARRRRQEQDALRAAQPLR